MESLQSLKSRRRAVSNIGQITKAMEVVSATKMRKAQEVALNSRPYAIHALGILSRVIRMAKINMPLTESRSVKKTAVLLISSDRGLAGSFNAQVLRVAENFLANDKENGKAEHKYAVVTIGKKAGAYAVKRGWPLREKFAEAGDFALPEETWPIANLLIHGFLKGEWDRVITISTHFRSTLKQEVLIRQILPVDFSKIKETVLEIIPREGRWAEIRLEFENGLVNGRETEYILEPSAEEALNGLLPHLLEMQIYHLMLEANASEHSARMVAMKAASDNAEELSGEITLEYNKARQAGITNELIEITSTQSAMV